MFIDRRTSVLLYLSIIDLFCNETHVHTSLLLLIYSLSFALRRTSVRLYLSIIDFALRRTSVRLYNIILFSAHLQFIIRIPIIIGTNF